MRHKLMDSWKTREYEVTGGIEELKIDAYKLMDSQKTREYNLKGPQKTDDEYEITDALNTCVQTKKVQKNECAKQFMCRNAEE